MTMRDYKKLLDQEFDELFGESDFIQVRVSQASLENEKSNADARNKAISCV